MENNPYTVHKALFKGLFKGFCRQDSCYTLVGEQSICFAVFFRFFLCFSQVFHVFRQVSLRNFSGKSRKIHGKPKKNRGKIWKNQQKKQTIHRLECIGFYQVFHWILEVFGRFLSVAPQNLAKTLLYIAKLAIFAQQQGCWVYFSMLI